ncbi:hypothetical protein Tco_1123629 [Tanacetum coccineum]|uniref:Uncharacterized protein n=1 Tax=Tanacetum coccineum TaxID=301880 RepID=A0ABQ5J7P2_9ASTR
MTSRFRTLSVQPLWGWTDWYQSKVIENPSSYTSLVINQYRVGITALSGYYFFGDIPTVLILYFCVSSKTSIYCLLLLFSSADPVLRRLLVASPTGLCGLWVPLFRCSDSDSPDDMSRIIARPSSSSEFPIAPVTAPPEISRRSAILIRLGEAIPFGRPYHTHLNGPRKLLTARKRVGPLPACRLARRHASPRSSDHHPSSSSSSSDSFHYSWVWMPPDQAFHHWCAAPLSTLYPPTTSESSSGDSLERPLHSSSHSAGPSRKRSRSLVDYVPSSTLVMGSLAPTRADLLPPLE